MIDTKALETEQAKLDALGVALKAELEKSALVRNNELAATLTKQFTDSLAAFKAELTKALPPSFSLPGVQADATGKNKNAFSLARAACAVRRGSWEIAPYENEVFKAMDGEWRQKAHSFGIDTSGGFLIPTELSNTIIEKLLPASIAFQLGAVQAQVGNVGSLTFNRETGTATAAWVGEMLSATKADLTFAQMTVAPKALSAKTDISNLLQLLGSNAAEERFVRSARRQFGLAIDKAIMIGAAGVKGPIGVANTPGINSSSSASLTYDKLVAFETALLEDNAGGMKMGWAASVTQYDAIRKLKDTANQPLLYRDVTAGGVKQVIGHPLLTSTQLGTTGANTLIFGAWEMVTLYQWFGGLILSRSDVSDNAIDNDLTRIALRMYADVGVEQPEAFCTASD